MCDSTFLIDLKDKTVVMENRSVISRVRGGRREGQ